MPIIPSNNLTLETGSQMADFSQPISTDMHLISWVTPDKQPAWISKSRTVMEQDNWSWRSAWFRNYFRLGLANSWQPRGSAPLPGPAGQLRHLLEAPVAEQDLWDIPPGPPQCPRWAFNYSAAAPEPPASLWSQSPSGSSLRHTAPLPAPSWPARNHTGRDSLQRKGNKTCPCHKAKLPLTLQTFSLLISSSVETSNYWHTLAGHFHLGYKSAPSSMVKGFSQEFPGQPPNNSTKAQSHALTYLTVPPDAHPLYTCINSLHILSSCISTLHSAFH